MSESDGESFLSRWSRRKRTGETADAAPSADAPGEAVRAHAPQAFAGEAPASEPPAIDLSALPPIESITASTDIRAFLAPGVPAELARAALRRAWVADPQIRNFVGIAENQWDFTDPNAIPGFGSIDPRDDMGKLLARVVAAADHDGGSPVLSAARTPPAVPSEVEINAATDISLDDGVAVTDQRSAALPMTDGQRIDAADKSIAPQNPEDDTAGSVAPVRRSHGGALPT